MHILASYSPNLLRELLTGYEHGSTALGKLEENRPIQSRIRRQEATGIYFETALVWQKFYTSDAGKYRIGDLDSHLRVDIRRYFALGRTFLRSDVRYFVDLEKRIAGAPVSGSKGWSAYHYSSPSRAFARLVSAWEKSTRGVDMQIIKGTLACRLRVANEPLFVPVSETDIKREIASENINYIATSAQGMWAEINAHAKSLFTCTATHTTAVEYTEDFDTDVLNIADTFATTKWYRRDKHGEPSDFVTDEIDAGRKIYMPNLDIATTVENAK